jgi:flagellar motor protein MotB/type III secretion system FlhB-like substrate exporter
MNPLGSLQAAQPVVPGRATQVWLLTFSDLVLLLLTFFILLFAMSDIDLGRYGALSRSTGLASVEPLLAETQEPTSDFTISQRELRPAEDLGYLKSVVTQSLTRDARFGTVATRLTDEYLVLSLPSSLLFKPGSAELSEAATSAVFDLAGLLSVLENAIAVTGHVGPEEIGSEPFLSDWELSLARAVRVSQSLRQSGYIGPMTVFGRSDIDYQTRSQNLPEPAREALAAVPNASVVITNPTHYAIALTYDMDDMHAPVLVAKGVDYLARRIRQIAEDNDVPLVENPPLARALYAAVEVDQEIPPEHYKAVAEIIGYVMQVNGKGQVAS